MQLLAAMLERAWVISGEASHRWANLPGFTFSQALFLGGVLGSLRTEYLRALAASAVATESAATGGGVTGTVAIPSALRGVARERARLARALRGAGAARMVGSDDVGAGPSSEPTRTAAVTTGGSNAAGAATATELTGVSHRVAGAASAQPPVVIADDASDDGVSSSARGAAHLRGGAAPEDEATHDRQAHDGAAAADVPALAAGARRDDNAQYDQRDPQLDSL